MIRRTVAALRCLSRLALAIATMGLGDAVMQDAAMAQSAPAGVPVTVATVTRKDVQNWARGLGTVQAYYSVQLRPRVDGTLIAVPVQEGQSVKAGELLALIDPRPYQAALDAAVAKRQQDQAQLANAQADLARYASLMRKDFASRQQVDTQGAQVKQLTATIAGDDAQVEAAKLNLDFCRIVAPFDGRVGLRNVDPGNFLRASEATPILSLAQIQPISVTFTLPQDALPAIAKAMQGGELTVDVYAGDNDKTPLDHGKLGTIDNSVDTTTGTIKLKASFPNPGQTLWPGQFVYVRLLLATEHDVIAAPAGAVQHGPNGLFVYEVGPNNTVSVQPITVARQESETYVVTSGLKEGAVVVTEGQSRLQNGATVAINQNKPTQTVRSGS